MGPELVHLPLLVADGVAALWLLRETTPRRFVAGLALQAVVAGATWVAGAALAGWSIFGAMSVLAALLFVHVPALAAFFATRTRRARPWLARAVGAATLAVALVGVDAFLVEPRWLVRTTVLLVSDKVQAPLRIALIADLQTDRVGAHEARALAYAAEAQPDLVLFAGDYLQVETAEDFARESDRLAAELRRAGLAPPLGAYAVRGDVDDDGWAQVFAGTGVVPVEASRTLRTGPIALTLLSPEDSRSARPPIPFQKDVFHVVVGHAPDYALANAPGDLLLAGHTHGGQVRLPFLGPLLTLSRVPRDMATGATRLLDGRWLVVSRGVGMERADAPRLRFLCPPEVVIVEAIPRHPDLTVAGP